MGPVRLQKGVMSGSRGLVWRRSALPGAVALVLLAYLLLSQRVPIVPRPAPLPAAQPRPPSRLLPHDYWQHRSNHPERYLQLSCTSLPAPDRILWAAASWQRHPLPKGSLYLYAAHWDQRGKEPLVRVLVYCDVVPLPNLICLLWYESRNAPEVVPANATYSWLPKWGGPWDAVNEPYILACPAPPGVAAPRAVSVTRAPCDAPRNVLAVQGAPRDVVTWRAPATTTVAACIKWLDYVDDMSADLVEWMELIRTFGAEKVYIYVQQAHPNMRRVLWHYEALGFADVTELDQAPREREYGSFQARSHFAMKRELLPLNDALYRAISRHAWLAVIDMDEIIVPLKYRKLGCYFDIADYFDTFWGYFDFGDKTWSDMIARVLQNIDMMFDAYQVYSMSLDEPVEEANVLNSHIKEFDDNVDAIVLRNYYFLDGAQQERAAMPPAHMLANMWRAIEPSGVGEHVKSFHNTSGVVSMHNHSPILCLKMPCKVFEVSLEIGRLQHYRRLCANNKPDCPELHATQRDGSLARFTHVLGPARALLQDLHIPLPTPRPLATTTLEPQELEPTETKEA